MRSVTHLAFDVLSFNFCTGNIQYNLQMYAERKKKKETREGTNLPQSLRDGPGYFHAPVRGLIAP